MHSTHETLQPLAPTSGAAPFDPELDAIGVELERAHLAVADLVARIDDVSADSDLLDALTEQIVEVLARVEQLRCARAQRLATQRRDEERWADYLDVA